VIRAFPSRFDFHPHQSPAATSELLPGPPGLGRHHPESPDFLSAGPADVFETVEVDLAVDRVAIDQEVIHCSLRVAIATAQQKNRLTT
jgi:hypothetical protein